jgi:hypothetical protein
MDVTTRDRLKFTASIATLGRFMPRQASVHGYRNPRLVLGAPAHQRVQQGDSEQGLLLHTRMLPLHGFTR